MAYENYTVRQFRDAWFKKDHSVISEEEFTIVRSEYVDTSGLFLSEDFEKQGVIYAISGRINYVKLFIRLQRDFIHNFKIPFQRDFKHIRDRYGYYLKWTGDLENFEEQLLSIERREIKQSSYLEIKINELNKIREKKGVKENETEEDLIESRKSFIRMINSLGKIGFKIDIDVTTVEELALMIKQQLEEQEQIRNASSKYGR